MPASACASTASSGRTHSLFGSGGRPATNTNWRPFGDSSRLHVSASYAPTDYVLGVPLSYTVAHGGNQFQWEALWMTSF